MRTSSITFITQQFQFHKKKQPKCYTRHPRVNSNNNDDDDADNDNSNKQDEM